jgi:large subunit ribosomal protein L6
MSRIGRQPILLPETVQISVDNNVIIVNGSKGELKQPLFAGFEIKTQDGKIEVTQLTDNQDTRKKYGLLRTLIDNMVIGVSEGFEKILEINGVGYRVEKNGEDLVFSLGFSHKINFKCPEGITFNVTNNQITVIGIDKQLVGQVASDIRSLKKPEPYKGKGIKYSDEVIRRKAGKTSAKG